MEVLTIQSIDPTTFLHTIENQRADMEVSYDRKCALISTYTDRIIRSMWQCDTESMTALDKHIAELKDAGFIPVQDVTEPSLNIFGFLPAHFPYQQVKMPAREQLSKSNVFTFYSPTDMELNSNVMYIIKLGVTALLERNLSLLLTGYDPDTSLHKKLFVVPAFANPNADELSILVTVTENVVIAKNDPVAQGIFIRTEGPVLSF